MKNRIGTSLILAAAIAIASFGVAAVIYHQFTGRQITELLSW